MLTHVSRNSFNCSILVREGLDPSSPPTSIHIAPMQGHRRQNKKRVSSDGVCETFTIANYLVGVFFEWFEDLMCRYRNSLIV